MRQVRYSSWKMTLRDLLKISTPARHFEGDSKIPWNEPGFSRRVLEEHLDQETNRASRPLLTVDLHVEWLHRHVLGGRRTRVLDVCCGPGLYANRLAERGHECFGIDFSPAAIEYAREKAGEKGLKCEYVHGDAREEEFGSGYGLGLLLFSELGTFSPKDAATILRKMFGALDAGGRMVLELQRLDAVQREGNEEPTWHRNETGLFSCRPHLYLEEHFWDEESRVSTARFYIIDAETGGITEYKSTMQAYSHREIAELVKEAGFRRVRFYPSLAGDDEDDEYGQFVVCARK